MKTIKILITLIVFVSSVSCSKRDRKLQYMPDMYESVAYDANGAKSVNNAPVNRLPVAGTVSRSGKVGFEYPNTSEGYDLAKLELKSPIKVDEANMENGKKMYGIYCAVCHGDKGDGNGILSQRDKFNGIPNYKDRDITEGSIYYVIMHGRNLMGSHAAQLTQKERWQVVQYVQKLRNDLMK